MVRVYGRKTDVPNCDFQGDHDKFIEDQRSEGDSNDVQKLILEEHE